MKTKIYTLLALMTLSVSAWSQAVGINESGNSAHPSAILDVESANRGVLTPRVANTAAVASPTNGLLIFDLSSNCLKIYQNGAWSGCLSKPGESVSALCSGAPTLGFNGIFVPGQPANAFGQTSIRVRLQNNSTLYAASFTPSTSDITLSPAGLTVASTSPSGNTPIPIGGFIDVNYIFSGTVPPPGVLTATFSRFGSTCSTTIDLSDPDIDVACTGSPNLGFSGIFVPGQSANFAGQTTVRVRILNNMVGIPIAFTPFTTDLAFSPASFTVASVTPSGSQTIQGGTFMDFDYVLSGTVPASGVVSATFSRLGLNCVTTLDINLFNSSMFSYAYNDIVRTCSQSPIAQGGASYSNWTSTQTGRITVNSSGVITGAATSGVSVIAASINGTNYRFGRTVTNYQKDYILTTVGNGSLYKPVGVTTFSAKVIGGGGGGRFVNSLPLLSYGGRVGAGGNGGNIAQGTPTVSAASGTINYTVGAGGNGGFSSSINGQNGSNSALSIGSVSMTAIGGRGGSALRSSGVFGVWPFTQFTSTGTSTTAANDPNPAGWSNTLGLQGNAQITSTQMISRGNNTPGYGTTRINTFNMGQGEGSANGLGGSPEPGRGGTGGYTRNNIGFSAGGNANGGAGFRGQVEVSFVCP